MICQKFILIFKSCFICPLFLKIIKIVELADKMKIIEEKTAELERNKSNTTFSLRNQLQTIQQKTAELDKSAKTINFEQNKNNLVLINITTALNGVQGMF